MTYLEVNASPYENLQRVLNSGNFLTKNVSDKLDELKKEHVKMKTIICLTIAVATIALSVIFGGFVGNVLGIVTIIPIGIWLGFLSKYNEIKNSYLENLSAIEFILSQMQNYFDQVRSKKIATMKDIFESYYQNPNITGNSELFLSNLSPDRQIEKVTETAEARLKLDKEETLDTIKRAAQFICLQQQFPYKLKHEVIEKCKLAARQFLKEGKPYLIASGQGQGIRIHWIENND